MNFSERLCLEDDGRRRSLLSPNEGRAGKAEPYRTGLRHSRKSLAVLLLFLALILGSCGEGIHRSGIPAAAQVTLDTAIEDIDAGRYEKLYDEAADEWRQQTTVEQSKATFQILREKLGSVRNRDLQSAREEQTTTAPVAGHSLTAIYQTTFDRGSAMETFTLLEHGGRWYLARYFVTSIALK